SALAGLIGEQVQVMFDGILLASEHIKTGKLRGLAITTVTRAETLPDIPTVSEFVPGWGTVHPCPLVPHSLSYSASHRHFTTFGLWSRVGHRSARLVPHSLTQRSLV